MLVKDTYPSTHAVDHAGDIGRIPAIGKAAHTRGQGSDRVVPDKNPFDGGSLTSVRRKSNSRFFTDCYHQAAAIGPSADRKSTASGATGVRGRGSWPTGVGANIPVPALHEIS